MIIIRLGKGNKSLKVYGLHVHYNIIMTGWGALNDENVNKDNINVSE